MKTSDIFLKHVVPVVGGCIAIGMFGSPMTAVHRVRQSGVLRELNPIPFPLIFANCCGWVAYSLLLQDAYLFVPNAVGLVFGLYMTASCFPYASPKIRDLMNFILLAEAVLVMVVGAATTIPSLAHATQKTVWGVTCVTVLFFYYFAPLSTLRQVLVTRDSASFYWPLCVMNSINGTLWLVYGLALQDYFLAVPNGVGALFSLVCVALCFVFPSSVKAGGGARAAAAPAAAAAAAASAGDAESGEVLGKCTSLSGDDQDTRSSSMDAAGRSSSS